MPDPIDIEVKDSVDSSVEKKLAGIAKQARAGHKALEDLKSALSGINSSPLADLQRASATHTNALARELSAQARMTEATNKGMLADARAAVEKQKLATESGRTAAAEANAARAATQSEAATLRLAQAQARAAAAKSADQRESERLASSVERLKMSVDPLGAALDRQNAELLQAQNLYRMGAIDAQTFAQAEATLRGRITATTEAIQAQNAAQLRGIQTSKAATQAGLNLSRQFADIGVTAAMGMNPLMILIQQGPQIADAFATAKTQGLGFKDLLKQLGIALGIIRVVNPQVAASNALLAASNEAVAATATMATAAETGLTGATAGAGVAAQATTAANAQLAASNAATSASSLKAAQGLTKTGTAAATAGTALGGGTAAGATAATTALAPLGIALAAIVAALAVVTVGFALFHRELSKGYPKDITDGLNLTEEQLERVKTKTVTFGDTVMATFTVVGRHIMEGPVGDALKWLGDRFTEVMDWIGEKSFMVVTNVIAFFVAAYRTITSTWRQFPSAFGDMVVSGINIAIRAIESLINKASDGLNFLIRAYNANPLNIIKLPELGKVELAEMTNEYAGAGADLGETFAENFVAAQSEVQANVRDFMSDISAEALRRARARAVEEAGDPNKGSKRRSGESEEVKRAKALRDINRELEDERALMGLVGDELAIESRMLGIINSLLQKKITLTDAEAVAIRAQVEENHALSLVQEQLESIYEDVTSAQRDYQNGLKAAQQLLDDGRISTQQHGEVVARLGYQYRQATDPLAKFNDEMRNEGELLGRFGVTLGATTRMQALRNDLAAQGKKLTEEETGAIRLQLEQRERELMINDDLGAIYALNQGAIEGLTARTVALSIAHQQGIIGAEQYRIGLNNVAMEAANVAIQHGEMTTAGQIALASLREYMTTYQGMLPGLTQSFSNFFTTVADGFANNIARAIVYAEDFGTAMREVARGALTELIASLIKMGIQWLITQAIGQTVGAAAAAASVAQGAAVAAAWAPAAAAVSLATMGANAIPASAAMVGTYGLAAALSSIPGLKDGGWVSGPGGSRGDKIPRMLSDDEFVVNAHAAGQNRTLLEAINAGRDPTPYMPTGQVRRAGNSGGPSAAVAPLRISIQNYGSSTITAERVGPDEVRIIAREVADEMISKKTPGLIGAEMADPSSKARKSLARHTDVQPKR